MMKTLIVDDEPVARQILRDELSLMSDIGLVGEADDGKEALRKILFTTGRTTSVSRYSKPAGKA